MTEDQMDDLLDDLTYHIADKALNTRTCTRAESIEIMERLDAWCCEWIALMEAEGGEDES